MGVQEEAEAGEEEVLAEPAWSPLQVKPCVGGKLAEWKKRIHFP